MSEQEKREKLIMLLRNWALSENDGAFFESIADYLLKNGVEIKEVEQDAE